MLTFDTEPQALCNNHIISSKTYLLLLFSFWKKKPKQYSTEHFIQRNVQSLYFLMTYCTYSHVLQWKLIPKNNTDHSSSFTNNERYFLNVLEFYPSQWDTKEFWKVMKRCTRWRFRKCFIIKGESKKQYDFYTALSKKNLVFGIKRKRRRSDPVLWQNPLYQQKIRKPKDNTQTPPKTSITQRLRTDLGRSVGVTSHPTGVVKPVYGYPTFPLTATAV